MISKLVFTILSIVLLLVFVLTNPEESELKSYIQENLKTEVVPAEAAPAEELGSAIKNVVAPSSKAAFMTAETERKNYYLFSLYKVSETKKYIGILNTFFVLPGSAPATE